MILSLSLLLVILYLGCRSAVIPMCWRHVRGCKMAAGPRRRVILEFLLNHVLQSTSARDHVWLDYGTLLGYVRHNRLINYDYDIDLGCNVKYYQKIRRDLEKNLDPDGFTIYCPWFTKYIQVIYKPLRLNVDITFYRPNIKRNELNACLPRSQHKLQCTDVYPLKKIGGYSVPRLSTEVLLPKYYGHTWTVPNKPNP